MSIWRWLLWVFILMPLLGVGLLIPIINIFVLKIAIRELQEIVMKRKITELEKNLIEKGWELDHKTYTGKHSEKTFQYVYE